MERTVADGSILQLHDLWSRVVIGHHRDMQSLPSHDTVGGASVAAAARVREGRPDRPTPACSGGLTIESGCPKTRRLNQLLEFLSDDVITMRFPHELLNRCKYAAWSCRTPEPRI